MLPRLHTLFLSTVPGVISANWLPAYHIFIPTQDGLALQRNMLDVYEKHSKVLRRVSFCSTVDWERGEDGDWYKTTVVPLR